MAWTKVGCIYLGMYTQGAQPHASLPTAYPAYLVQTLANVTDPSPYPSQGPVDRRFGGRRLRFRRRILRA